MALTQHGKSWNDACFVLFDPGVPVRATSLSTGYTASYLSVAYIIKILSFLFLEFYQGKVFVQVKGPGRYSIYLGSNKQKIDSISL